MILIASPGNPTGVVYRREDVEALAALARDELARDRADGRQARGDAQEYSALLDWGLRLVLLLANHIGDLRVLDECERIGRDPSTFRFIHYSVLLPGASRQEALARHRDALWAMQWKYSDMEASATRSLPPPSAPPPRPPRQARPARACPRPCPRPP